MNAAVQLVVWMVASAACVWLLVRPFARYRGRHVRRSGQHKAVHA